LTDFPVAQTPHLLRCYQTLLGSLGSLWEHVYATKSAPQVTVDNFVHVSAHCPCPLQRNTFNCGLFSAALHLLEGMPVDGGLFDQGAISQLQLVLSEELTLLHENNKKKKEMADYKHLHKGVFKLSTKVVYTPTLV